MNQDPQIITEIVFIDKYNCKWRNYPFEKDDWEKLEKINLMIALNVFMLKKKKIHSAYGLTQTKIVKNKLFF